MNTKTLCALLLLLVGSPTFASDVEPGELVCYDAIGGTTVRDIDQAHPAGGGISFQIQFATGRSFTSELCLANVGPAPEPAKEVDEVLIHCEDPVGLVAYHRPAETWSAESGVLTWVETETREVYVSTLECFVTSIDGD
jgi:hypothetical protein